jgi:hypothetical protein
LYLAYQSGLFRAPIPATLIEDASPRRHRNRCIQVSQEGAMPQPKRPKTTSAPAKAAHTKDTSPGRAPVTFLECIPQSLAADLTQRAAREKKTLVQVVEDALRSYLAAPGSTPRTAPPQVKGEISFGNLGGPTVPEWGGGAKGRRKS